MMQPQLRCSLSGAALVVGSVAMTLGLPFPAIAQIQPDSTLGNESSVVTAPVLTERGWANRIEGGAIRGSNLFHSFTEFNIGTGQRVYFANPVRIENIIGRVTGNTRSSIDGTLGVLGTANLYLINPNGLVFGPNAQLDIRGSFFASTTDRVLFQDGYEFSATRPTAPPLLTINAPLGLGNILPTAGTIATTGNLTVAQDLTLAAARLDLQGELRAGGNLSLLASDTLTARDSVTRAFVAAAGQDLHLQGNQSLDIAVLNHPNSSLLAGGNLVLRSSTPVIADAHIQVGGNLRVEQLDGSLGDVLSDGDPVYEVAGDFSLNGFTGASLQILAGGSVTIPGTVTINAAGSAFNNSTVTLSNGTALTIQGTTRPTLDVRAGTTRFFGTPTPGTPTRANITIGNIVNQQANGLVFLTNQYQPSTLPGNITVAGINTSRTAGGGTVVVDSRGTLTVNGSVNTSATTGNGGSVTLLAQGDLSLVTPLSTGSSILTSGQLGGSITLSSSTGTVAITGTGNRSLFPITSSSSTSVAGLKGGNITLTGENIRLSQSGTLRSTTSGRADSGDVIFRARNAITIDSSETNTTVQTGATGNGGNLTIAARSLFLRNRGQVLALTQGSGNAGNLSIEADQVSFDNTGQAGSLVNSSTARGNAGAVTVKTRSLSLTNGSTLFATTTGIGNAGNLTIDAADSVVLDGASQTLTSVERGATGKGGNTTIRTQRLAVTNGSQIRSSTRGPQNAGNVDIQADTIWFDGVGSSTRQPTAITSTVLTGGTGNGGNISLKARQISFTNGAAISANTNSTVASSTQGNAGDVWITADSVTFDGIGNLGFNTAVRTDTFGPGRGGQITIAANSLQLTNGAQLRSNTSGQGNAGNILVKATDSVLLAGSGTGLFASTTAGSQGRGGTIEIDPNTVTLRDGARISVDSQGTGVGGDVRIQTNLLLLENQAVISADTASANGGNITLQVPQGLVLRQGSRISTNAGTAQRANDFGNGGNIQINTNFITAVAQENSDITANAYLGRGGRVDITAQGIFGIEFRPQLTSLSDITVSSQFGLDGVVTITSPDVDPSRSLVALPANLVDASRLVAQGCSAQGGRVAQQQNEFVVTGRGGLPPGPSDTLGSQPIWQDLRPLPQVTAQPSPSQRTAPTAKSGNAPIVEVQGWTKTLDGEVLLVAQTAPPPLNIPWLPAVTCQNLEHE